MSTTSNFTAPQLRRCNRGCCHFIDGREVTPEESEIADRDWASEVGPDGRAGGVGIVECRRTRA